MLKTICSGTIATGETFEQSLEIISELGFREFDLLFVTGWAHLGLDELAKDYAAMCSRVDTLLHRYNLSIASVNAKYSIKLEDSEEELIVQRQLEYDAMLRFMADFGCNRVSIQPTLTQDSDYLQRTYAAFVQETNRQQQYAAQRGISISLEPHIMSSVCTNEALRALISQYPDFKITYDPSHLLHSGETIQSTDYLFKNTTLVHLRDARKDELFVPSGQGGLDIPFVVYSLKAVGYDGPIVLEYLSAKRDKAVYDDLLSFKRQVDECIYSTRYLEEFY